MQYNFIINKIIYSKFKGESLKLHSRLFCDEHFYNLETFNYPIELTGTIDYLPYCDAINIYSTSTFIDYINILLICSFLFDNKYHNFVKLNYVNQSKDTLNDSIYSSVLLFENDYECAKEMIQQIKNKQKVENVVSKIPGSSNFVNFYNSLLNPDIFLNLISDLFDEYEGDNNEIAAHLANRYSQMGLSVKFFNDYLNSNIKDEEDAF